MAEPHLHDLRALAGSDGDRPSTGEGLTLQRPQPIPQAVIDGLDAIVWELDARTWRLVSVSAGAERILGYPRYQWLGESDFWRRHLHPDDRDRAVAEAVAITKGGAAHAIEYRMIARDGRAVWLRDLVRAVVDESGEATTLYGVMVDITAQKELEAALRESEERFSRFAEVSDDGVFVHEQGRIVDANPAMAAMLGYTVGELVGRMGPDFTVPEERGRLIAHIASGSEEPIEGHALRKDGTVFPVEIKARNLVHRGVPTRVATMRDISERRAAERADRESAARMRLILRQIPGMVWTTDRELRLTSLLGSVLSGSAGDSYDSAIGRSLRDLFHGRPEGATVLAAHEEALAGKAGGYPVEWRDAVYEAHVEPLRDADGVIHGVIGVALDVTERLRTETTLRETEEQLRQSQKLEAIGRLAGGIAHDFNNLLTVISTFTQLVLADLSKSDPRSDDLQQVQNAAMRASELTRQLLAFGRKQAMQPVVLAINTVVRDVERMLHRVIGEDVTLTTSLAAQDPRIRADRGQIEQALMNLVVNARDAMPHGGSLHIATSLETTAGRKREPGEDVPAGHYVRLDVTDTGTGMDETVKAHLFEPFFTTKPPGSGTGLGLPMVYGIVRQSGGFVTVRSSPGAGATLSLFFPQVRDPVQPERPPRAPVEHRGAVTVLVVEDEHGVRGVAKRILQAQGYRVLEARSGNEAIPLAMAHTGPIDLLLSDLVMPGIPGRELAERLVELRPAMRVLFMSGYTDAGAAARGRQRLGAEVLAKPFTPEQLSARVRATLDASPVRPQEI